MKYALLFLMLLMPLYTLEAGEHIAIYRIGEKNPLAWNLLSKYLGNKGYTISVYEGTDIIERHVEMVNRINKSKASLFLALDFVISDQENLFVAVAKTEKAKGTILPIQEVPSLHLDSSREAANQIAGAFSRSVSELPLFPLLGVNMPGVLVRMECSQERSRDTLDRFHEGLQKYFARGYVNEK